MVLKFIQVNIYKGKYLDNLLDFLKKENPDFIAAQEVTYGVQNLCQDKNLHLFDYLGKELGLNGIKNIDLKIENNLGYHANAVFTKHQILETKVLVLKRTEVASQKRAETTSFFPLFPRCVVDAICEVHGKVIHAMSWHGAWTAPPTDTKETLRQAGLVREYLLNLKKQNVPFLLGGDLNSTVDKKTVRMISEVANNLMTNSGVVQTTHPVVHKIAPRGFLVDYIFTSNHFKLIKLTVPEITVSDHLPVIAELEF